MLRNFILLALAGVALAAHGKAEAQECDLTIDGNDQIQFSKDELRVPASCGEVTLTLRHVGMLAENVMGHNWVLSETAEWQALAMAGQAAGAPEYLPEGDERIIAATPVIGGGEETSITFDVSGLEAGGDYTFFCSFPGHYTLMNGKFIIE